MKRFAFTMAEILISLTIIGIIAAITLPALQANINEKAWNTQRKALYTRLSQAIALMPALNGFGTTGTAAEIRAKAASTFITDGLAKTFKINNICDKDHLQDCGIPAKITILGGENIINVPKKLTELNPGIMYAGNPDVTKYIINSDAAAFETTNGESVLTFYNPYCVSKDVNIAGTGSSGIPGIYHKLHVCANFIYDLNGSKGPNSVGKDIGFITALYPTDASVVMVIPTILLDQSQAFADAIRACKNVDEEYTVPNYDEVISLYYNNNLHNKRRATWASNAFDADNGWYMGYEYGMIYGYPKTDKLSVTCIKR